MVHHFRHDEYIHIKPVLIVCVVIILLIAGGAVAIYYATKPKDIDFSTFYRPNKKSVTKDADDSNDDHADGVVAGAD